MFYKLIKNKRRALISVSDKTGVVEMARELAGMGWEVVSTGGTGRTLNEEGIAVTPVEDLTGFPEILGGRVKTLNPKIHGGILARLDQEGHCQELREHGINPIELVVVNLYPFAQTISRPDVNIEEAIENIDIGGPTMVRAAAKNYKHVAVVVKPGRYIDIIKELKEAGSISMETRFSLAAEAFSHTAQYDALISSYLNDLTNDEGLFPRELTLPFIKAQDLRYGENPQQKAAFYSGAGKALGLAAARQLQGKELSFNNINDLNAAWELALEFQEPAVVAVKHANPCGVGVAERIEHAYTLAHDADPVSIFGGVLAVNRPVNGELARELVKIFLEVVAAPSYTDEAQKILSGKKDMRLLELEFGLENDKELDIKRVRGGILLQTRDNEAVDLSNARVVTRKEPAQKEWADLLFAQKVVKHIKSNAIVAVKGGQTLGVGAGQMSRIAAARIAMGQAGKNAVGAVMGSDAFFPFSDTVEIAAAAGITSIIQPGGSLKDEESIEACDRLGLSMVFTGRRYFKH